jgi:hypothetical protein
MNAEAQRLASALHPAAQDEQKWGITDKRGQSRDGKVQHALAFLPIGRPLCNLAVVAV